MAERGKERQHDAGGLEWLEAMGGGGEERQQERHESPMGKRNGRPFVRSG